MKRAKLKKPVSPKERNLIKGALRRVFSRSDLRRQALELVKIEYSDPSRPRVTKWGYCTSCGILEPNYLLQVDHAVPIIKVNETLEDLTWDQVIEAMWCEIDNLKPVCKDCHKSKTKEENKARRLNKGSRK